MNEKCAPLFSSNEQMKSGWFNVNKWPDGSYDRGVCWITKRQAILVTGRRSVYRIKVTLKGRRGGMKIDYGDGTSEFGPGINIELTGDEVAIAIDAFLVANGVNVQGSRTVTVNGHLCESGRIYVDPSGFVAANGGYISGRGPQD